MCRIGFELDAVRPRGCGDPALAQELGSRYVGTNGVFCNACTSSSNLLLLAAEIRLPLLAKRPAAFFRFLGAVEQRQRLKAKRADGAQVLAVGVERALADGDCRRAFLANLGAPLVDLFFDVLARPN